LDINVTWTPKSLVHIPKSWKIKRLISDISWYVYVVSDLITSVFADKNKTIRCVLIVALLLTSPKTDFLIRFQIKCSVSQN
jgi:hypothetical protein